MYVKYQCQFYSQNQDSTADSYFQINIHKRTGSDDTIPFKCTSDGFTLKMAGGDDGMIAPIKTTSVSFNFIIEAATSGIVDDILSIGSENENEYIVTIERWFARTGETEAWRGWWFGVLLGDLAGLDDTSPNKIITLKAVDGITQLKYKNWDSSTYQGHKSALRIIKICLSQITTTDDDWDLFATDDAAKRNFILHTPFYYNKAMGALDSTWKEDVDHDPLALTSINTYIFQDSQKTPWSYYKILEQILATFQLRLMMSSVVTDSMSGGGEPLINGRAVWYLQAPMLNHENDNNDNFNANHLTFYHNKDLTTDVAVEYDDAASCTVKNPIERASGGKEMFIAPLLSYKTIYHHDIFYAVTCGPVAYNSAAYEDGTLEVKIDNFPNDIIYEPFFPGLGLPLTNIQPDVGSMGWTYPSEKVAKQRLLITGSVTVYPIDMVSYFSSGEMGYVSAEEYFDEFGELWTGGIYLAQEIDVTQMVRMGLRLFTQSENVDDGSTEGDYWWLGQDRFSWLTGSVPWARDTGYAYESDQYANNWAGIDTTADPTYGGTRYDMDNPDTEQPFDSNGIAMWGVDSGDSNAMYWFRGDEGGGGGGTPYDNHWAYFSPIFHNYNNTILNVGASWVGNYWASVMGDLAKTETFAIQTPQIPWGRSTDGDGDYGWSELQMISLYYGFRRDQVIDDSGTKHYACARDWNHNKELLCEHRGVTFAYSLSEVRVFVVGSTAGAGSFDYGYGWYENGNGNPSEEEVQSPEIIIGDEPQFDPFADLEEGEFGGDYSGQFMIFTEANETTNAQTGADTQDWRTQYQGTSSSEDMKLHIKRAKQALAHRYQIKQKLELNFVDRTVTDGGWQSTREIEGKLFSGIYYWTSGDWYQNQASSNIAFIVTGGSFTAGTGKIKLILEDCVTYSKDNLIDNSYSSNSNG